MVRNFPLIKRWVESLLNGTYEQGIGRLNNENKFCCLGVLCDLVDPKTWVDSSSNMLCGLQKPKSFRVRDGGHYLTSEQCEEFGITYTESTILAEMNDKRNSFEVIAQWITDYILSEEKESETQS